MTSPQRSLQANSRGIAVLIAAVVVGLLLLTQAGAGGGGAPEGDAAPPTTEVEEVDTTTTTDLDAEPEDTEPGAPNGGEAPEAENGDGGEDEEPEDEAEDGPVQVSVLNASGVTGLAATTMDQVADAGYEPGFVGNAAATDTTAIYYREGYQAEATALASLFGKSSDIVEALSSPFEGTSDADVVIVVLGADFQS